MKLSDAIRSATGDPFEAAYSALVPRPPFMSEDSRRREILEKLHEEWPALGATVRTWLALADRLEETHVLPRARRFQTDYRQEIHLSLWGVIARWSDKDGQSNRWIATELTEFGL